MTLASAADVYTKLSVGDGLVSQIPALIVSLSAGLLVSKGGTRGSAEQNILRQLGMYPRALFVAALLMFMLALIPGLPLAPFGALGGIMAFIAYLIPKHAEKARLLQHEAQRALERQAQQETRESARDLLRIPSVELSLGKQLWAGLLPSQAELGNRVLKMRRNFARDYGFVFPDIKLSDDLDVRPKHYQIRIQGALVASRELRLRHHLIIIGRGAAPDLPGEETTDPAFGIRAMWIPDAMVEEAKRQGFSPIDCVSVLLTHLSETLRNNLAQLLTYKDMRALMERLEPEYKRLVEDMVPSLVTHSTLQGALKLLLAERVSIRNLELILEAIAEVAPFARRAEPIVEHVRARLGSQICSDLSVDGVLGVLRLGARWDLFFHEHLKRDPKGEILGFDADPAQIEKFALEAGAAIRERMERGEPFIVLTAPEARPYVRLLLSRPFPSQAVLSHLEVAGGVQVKSLGAIS
jgi:flagellar biosynthesis protein FlhA